MSGFQISTVLLLPIDETGPLIEPVTLICARGAPTLTIVFVVKPEKIQTHNSVDKMSF
jgi:hypothetical protein